MNMSDSQASQLIGQNPTRRIGDKIAERIERVFELKLGELDAPPEETTQLTVTGAVTDGVASLIAEIQRAAEGGVFTHDLLHAFHTILRLAQHEKRPTIEDGGTSIKGRGSVESAQDAVAQLEHVLDAEADRGSQSQHRAPRTKRG
ncbi:hypothetical protein JQC70_22240 [Burkholderia contaminans]|nr:hypothetical protein [Burkholderia sp. 4NA327B6]MBM6427878.1 hypothetical protein [Burkholderia contaminans]